jgi:putative transposase
MARKPRSIIAGYPFHVIVRGNNRQAIFHDDDDRASFKSILKEACLAHGLAVHAYVMMTNHVHLIGTPARDEALARVMQAVGRQYVRRFNHRHGRTGTLWEGRYRASLIQGDRHLLACQRYVEMNPVRAGMVGRPEQYEWSSHRHHLGLASDPLVSPHTVYWALGNTPFERELAYRALFESLPPVPDEELTHRLLLGHPVADAAFLEDLEMRSGRALVPRPVGRPRKASAPGAP